MHYNCVSVINKENDNDNLRKMSDQKLNKIIFHENWCLLERKIDYCDLISKHEIKIDTQKKLS